MGKRNDMSNLAKDIYEWCVRNEVWQDCCIYIAGDAYATWKDWEGENGEKLAENLYKYECKNPLEYCQYANPETITFTFEGGLYQIMNCYWEYELWTKQYDDFCKLFDKYDCWFEQGYHYSLSVYLD